MAYVVCKSMQGYFAVIASLHTHQLDLVTGMNHQFRCFMTEAITSIQHLLKQSKNLITNQIKITHKVGPSYTLVSFFL